MFSAYVSSSSSDGVSLLLTFRFFSWPGSDGIFQLHCLSKQIAEAVQATGITNYVTGPDKGAGWTR